MRPETARRLARGILLAGILAFPGPAGAAGSGLTPEAAVARALAGHPAIRSAESGVESAAARSSLSRSGYLPRVDLTQDLVRSNNPVFVFGSKLGQQRFSAADFALESLNEPEPFTNSATRLVLHMSVWDAGRTRLDRKAAALGVESAEMSRIRTRHEVAFNALRAYWGVVLADEMLEVARSAEAAAGAGLELASSLVDEGVGLPSDRMQARVRLAEVREQRIMAERQIEVARAALREALGAPPGESFELEPGELPRSAPGASLESLVEEALAERADLKAMERELGRAGTGESRARSTWLPEVGVGAQYEWNASDVFGNDGDNWTVGASLRVPLFEGMETSARLDEARARVRGMEAERDRLVEGIRLQVITAWSQAQAAAGRTEVTATAAEEAEESLRIVRERYAEGMAVVLELLDAEAALTRARGNRVAAAHDLAVSRAALDLAVGRDPGQGSLQP